MSTPDHNLDLSLDGLMSIEKQHSAFGKYPESDNASAAVYIAQIRDYDSKRAQALVLSESEVEIPSLLKIRTWISRGSLTEALTMIRQALRKAESPLERSELLLEKTRVLNYQGRWRQALSVIDEAFDLKPTPVSKLTLFQMKAHAHYEAGQMTEALACLDQVEVLGRVFPHSISRIYALALRTKIQARDRGPEFAQTLLRKIWNNLWTSGNLDADSALTFLRVQLDVERLEGRDVLPLALSTYLLAEQMGDQQFMALACLDAYVSAGPESRRILDPELNRARASFERVNALALEALGEGPARTVSGTSLQRPSGPVDDTAQQALLQSFHGAKAIVLSRDGLVLSLSPWRIESTSTSPQLESAIRLLCAKRTSKREVFASLWRNQKYSPRLHDTLIWNLVYRLKKEAGLAADVTPSGIFLRDVLFIQDESIPAPSPSGPPNG